MKKIFENEKGSIILKNGRFEVKAVEKDKSDINIKFSKYIEAYFFLRSMY